VVVKPLESTPREPARAPSVVTTQPKPEPELQTTQAESAPSEIAPSPKPQRELKSAKPRTQPAPAAAEKASQPEPNPSALVSPDTEGPPRETGAAAPAGAAIPAPERPVDSPAPEAAGRETVMSMADLPLPIREELPAMTITVHAYSDKPEARLVGINYRILREGDYVVPGLRLEQITPDGMIFRYKGYRFRRGVK
jgi:general secretion pathway protein B